MAVDLFAGISVSDFQASLAWYERFFGGPAAFFPNDVEAVWEVGGHQYVYIEDRPEHAGHAQVTMFSEDFDERVDGIVSRGIDPDVRETYDNGVRHVTFRDPDGNELSVGGAPLADEAAVDG